MATTSKSNNVNGHARIIQNLDDGRLEASPDVAFIVSEIYGKPLSEISPPEGYEFTGEFRNPCAGEWFLSCYNSYYGNVTYQAARDIARQPRLILRKKPKVIGYKFIHTETRVPRQTIRKGEWYSCPTHEEDQSIYRAISSFYLQESMSYFIYSREEIFE